MFANRFRGTPIRQLASRLYGPIQKEVPSDAVLPSHRLLIQAGYIRKTGLGSYTLLPLAFRTLTKLQNLIYHHLSVVRDCQRVQMPLVLPAELWKVSGRWTSTGPELLRMADRHEVCAAIAELCLGPTHEECVTDLVTKDVVSYKNLPLKIYQMGTKYRDEIRPRFGLMRAREFLMKDLYTFDGTKDDALHTYEDIRQAYHDILQDLGLQEGVHYSCVEADVGNIGGLKSQEFHLISDVGEDTLMACSDCGYAANQELASTAPAPSPASITWSDLHSLSPLLPQNLPADVAVSVLKSDGEQKAVVVFRSARISVNPLKIQRGVNGDSEWVAVMESASDEFTLASVESAVGSRSVSVVFDKSVPDEWKSVHVDELHASSMDVALVQHGDKCNSNVDCNGMLARRGIEVGHVFLLGSKYSTAFDAKFIDKDQQMRTMEMGCYGIGVSRLAAGLVELGHDVDGIRWPLSVAPITAVVLNCKPRDEAISGVAEKVYDLLAGGIAGGNEEVVLDDRNDSAGRKIQSAFLAGIPLIVAVGRKKGQVEIIYRNSNNRRVIGVEELPDAIPSVLDALHSESPF